MIKRFCRMMFRLMPVLVLLYVLDSSTETFQGTFQKAGDMAESAVTMGEMNMLKAMIIKDFAMGNNAPDEYGFQNFCYRSLKRRGSTKDIPPYQDRWRNNYEYERLGERSFRIRSAGPDSWPGNEDDIVVEYR